MAEYMVNGMVFSSKAALQSAVRDVLGRYAPGDTLDGADTDFLYDVLCMHPEADRKIGAGVKSFTVRVNPTYKQKEFYLHRTDGTATDFSYLKCLRAPTHRARVLAACRFAIAPGILSFRNAYFKANGGYATCPLSGIIIEPNTAHIDHKPPRTFRALFEKWIVGARLDIDSIDVTSGEDNSHTVRFVNPVLESSWLEFHWKHAELRAISAAENLKLGRGTDYPLAVRTQNEAGLTPEQVERRAGIRREMLAAGWVLMEDVYKRKPAGDREGINHANRL